MGMLRADDRLGVGERRQGLVALCRQEQPFDVPTEAVALIVLPEERIKLLAVGLKGARSGRNREAASHGWFSSPVLLPPLLLQQTTAS
jgi:hypothetical protein